MRVSRRRLLAAAAASTAVGVAGCGGGPTTTTSGAAPPDAGPPDAAYAYTHLRASGNRVLGGRGAVDDAAPVEIPVQGTPAWLLAFGDAASHWTVVTVAGAASTHRVADGTSELVERHGAVPAPPLAYRADGAFGVAARPADCAAHTHPVPVDGVTAYVAADGALVLRRGRGDERLGVGAPPDARLVAVGEGRYALYGDRTGRYDHGALGDTVEGGSLVVVDVRRGRVATTVTLDPPAVFEGLSPLVADVDGDGTPELVTTVATAADGARVRVYDTDGTELATGPVDGPGWRHQLCVAPVGPDDTPELAVVRRPHVDWTVEFYRLADGDLTVTATREGYATHVYGSRNLDGGLGADLDGDGRTEFLLPAVERDSLAAVRRVGGRVEPAWSLSLDGVLRTNVAGVALADGRVAVGAGTAGEVRVWQG